MAFPLSSNLRAMRVGVLLSLLGILFGFGVGGAFGAFEDQMKAGLKADAEAVVDTVYKGDAAKVKEVLDKSWSYYKRAHLHGGGIGAAALAVILTLAAAGGVARRMHASIAAALGVGSLGYPIYWLLAAMRAPSLGSTSAAKESLDWLAIPSAGCLLLGLIGAIVVVARASFGTSDEVR